MLKPHTEVVHRASGLITTSILLVSNGVAHTQWGRQENRATVPTGTLTAPSFPVLCSVREWARQEGCSLGAVTWNTKKCILIRLSLPSPKIYLHAHTYLCAKYTYVHTHTHTQTRQNFNVMDPLENQRMRLGFASSKNEAGSSPSQLEERRRGGKEMKCRESLTRSRDECGPGSNCEAGPRTGSPSISRELVRNARYWLPP